MFAKGNQYSKEIYKNYKLISGKPTGEIKSLQDLCPQQPFEVEEKSSVTIKPIERRT